MNMLKHFITSFIQFSCFRGITPTICNVDYMCSLWSNLNQILNWVRNYCLFLFSIFLPSSIFQQDLSSEALFKDIDNQFYSISKRMYYLLAKIQAPCYMFPVVFVSIFKFISSNHDKSSFQQHFPAT